jgi:hypothetical protein
VSRGRKIAPQKITQIFTQTSATQNKFSPGLTITLHNPRFECLFDTNGLDGALVLGFNHVAQKISLFSLAGKNGDILR